MVRMEFEAWATTTGVGYRCSKAAMFGKYDYASGDGNPTDGVHGTFDTIDSTAHDRLGIAVR